MESSQCSKVSGQIPLSMFLFTLRRYLNSFSVRLLRQ